MEKEMDENALLKKKEILIRHLKRLDSLLVAFSGGVDSTFLLALAHDALGDRAVAATIDSVVFPKREKEEAIRFTALKGIQHIILLADEILSPDFLANDPKRCYYCKRTVSEKIQKTAQEKGLRYVAHAANMDDLGDYRPGLRAAQEMGIIAPLIDAKLNKEEIRLLSKEMALPTWDKPSMACLASRIPYGEPITEKKLKMVEEAEGFLSENGFRQCRVRHHGPVARIEVERDEIKRITEFGMGGKIIERFKEIGFLHIAVDLEGYNSGSLNRMLDIPRQPLDIPKKKEGLSNNGL